MIEQRVEILEKTTSDHEVRIRDAEQALAVGSERFRNIQVDIGEIKATLKSLTTWTQATAATLGLSMLGALIAWLLTRGGN